MERLAGLLAAQRRGRLRHQAVVIVEDGTLKDEIQRLWLAWTDEADADGRTDFYGLQRLARTWRDKRYDNRDLDAASLVYGSSAHLLMKRKTAYGQAATGDFIRMPFNRCNLGSEQA